VVYTSAHNDTAELKKHRLTGDEETRVRKAFAKAGKLPKSLIVTEKLLTGYDVPVLYCMYLDKPMRDHVLLQAIARVNRPYEEGDRQVKPAGFVLDFVGIFENLQKALAFDSEEVGSVIQNIGVIKALFRTLMREWAKAYLKLARGHDDKAFGEWLDADKPFESPLEGLEAPNRTLEVRPQLGEHPGAVADAAQKRRPQFVSSQRVQIGRDGGVQFVVEPILLPPPLGPRSEGRAGVAGREDQQHVVGRHLAQLGRRRKLSCVLRVHGPERLARRPADQQSLRWLHGLPCDDDHLVSPTGSPLILVKRFPPMPLAGEYGPGLGQMRGVKAQHESPFIACSIRC
jgi:hypothetical protein